MSQKIKKSVIALWVGILLVATGQAAETKEGFIQPKFPPPASVSEEAQKVLAKPIDLRGRDAVPQTFEEWQALRDARNKGFIAMVQNAAAAAPVTVVKHEIAGVTVREVIPDTIGEGLKDKVLINVHGGGYVMLGGEASYMEAIAAASYGGFRVFAVDYRMPPEHPFPAAVDDAVAVYEALLEDYAPGNIGFFGASAGGGLAAAMTLAARDRGLPLPGAVALNTPWSDLTKTGDSYFTNDGVDPVLTSYDGSLAGMAKLYAGEHDMKHPLLSPVYADYSKGFPPTFLLTGTRDLFLSNTVRQHRALRAAGIEAELHVFEAMWHGFSTQPEYADAQQEMATFFRKHLGK